MKNQERFYNWMLAMGNVHLANNEKMSKAYEVITQSDAQVKSITLIKK